MSNELTVPAAPTGFNVIALTCIPTGMRMIAVRKASEKLKTLRARYVYGAKTGNTERSVCSVRQYGIDNHTLEILAGPFETREEALQYKLEVIERDFRSPNRNRATLAMVTPNWAPFKIDNDNEALPEIPDQYLGRRSKSYGFYDESELDC